ncbi:MAG TPA: TonB-dependent receptor [Novosphingobium sp.]
MRTNTIRTATSIFGLIGLAAVSAPAFAQASDASATVSDEIVVTAQRREERSVDVPITITAIGAQQLATANIQTLTDISKVTPALRFDNNSAFVQPTIRGVGTPVTTSGGGSNVGIYVDNFYSPNPLAADFQFLNVKSVQVLKGPQGTLFGRNTTGGAILVQTADPSTETAFRGKVSYARFNDVNAQAYTTLGLAQNVAVDLEGLYHRGDGWKTNIIDGKKVGDFEDWIVRAGLKVNLTDSLSAMVRYTHSYTNDPNPALVASYRDPIFGDGAYNTPDNQKTYKPNEIGTYYPIFIKTKSDVFQGTIKADLGFADLSSFTQYRKENVDSSISLNYAGAPFFALGLPNKNSTWSQEILMNSKPGSKLQWTAGFFAFGNKDTYITYIDGLGPTLFYPNRVRLGGSGTNTQTFAGFVDATYEVTPKLFLTAGLRYSHDRVIDAYWNTRSLATSYVKDGVTIPAPNGVVPVPDISSNRWTPRVVLRFKPDDNSSIYASFTQGYKAAIIDVGGSCQNASGNLPTATNPTGAGFTCNPVKPEKINSYEAGYKYNNGMFSAELSGFYYDYTNLQVSVFLVGGQANIINAANAKIYGLDGQFSVRFSDHFTLNAAGAWTHARYTKFEGAPVFTRTLPVGTPIIPNAGNPFTIGIPFVTLKDSPMQRSPAFTGNVGATYTADLGGGKAQLSGLLNYSSKVYFGPSGNQFFQDGYATLALRAQWTDPSEHFTVAVFGDNVTDKRYMTEVQSGGNGVGANWSRPATYGIELGVKY